MLYFDFDLLRPLKNPLLEFDNNFLFFLFLRLFKPLALVLALVITLIFDLILALGFSLDYNKID